MVALIIGALVLVLAILMAYQRYVAGKKPVQHLCDYCGHKVAAWWASDVRIEPEYGGRYEGTLPEGRVEGTITAIDGPSKLSFMWPIPKEGGSTETSVIYELAPKGPQTFIHLIHRSPFAVPGDWNGIWQRALNSLKTMFEGGSANPP